jgi:hypothetical protein
MSQPINIQDELKQAHAQQMTRRALLGRTTQGLGLVALASLGLPGVAGVVNPQTGGALAGSKALTGRGKAKRVIWLSMAGGPSHLETFDPKPKLAEMNGKPMPESMTKGQQIAQLQGSPLICFGPQHPFQKFGKNQTEICSLFPKIGSVIDDICLIRSMTTDAINHDPAHMFMNTGSQIAGRPSMGAWVNYGLGSEAEDLPGFVVARDGKPFAPVVDGDAVVFFNFRGDRPRELTMAFTLSDEAWAKVKSGGFRRDPRPLSLHFVTMTGYEEGLPVRVAFERPAKMAHIMGEWISSLGLTQFRCAETEKFPHVTFFFNDYREEPFPGERRTLVPSPKDVETYDQKPEMSAYGVRDAVLARLAAPDCEPFIVVNFANPDMVGHTGNLQAVVKACEVVDECVGQLMAAALARGGSLVITADHGNAEQMKDPKTGEPQTAHTNFTVELFVVGEAFRGATLREGGRLADVAPTMLAMMGLPKPAEMSGESLT